MKKTEFCNFFNLEKIKILSKNVNIERYYNSAMLGTFRLMILVFSCILKYSANKK